MKVLRGLDSITVLRNCLFLLFYTENILTTLASEKVECEAEAYSIYESEPTSNLTFQCSIRFTNAKHKNRIGSSCRNYDNKNNSLVVTAVAPIRNLSFVCTSNYAISVKVDFANGTVLKPYLKMKWGRKFTDFNNQSTYSYILRIFPSEIPLNWETGNAVMYTLSSVRFPNETIQVLWFSLGSYHSTKSKNALPKNNIVYWMGDTNSSKPKLTMSDVEIFIPCVSPFSVELYKHEAHLSWRMKNISPAIGGFLVSTRDDDDKAEYGCRISQLNSMLESRMNITNATAYFNAYLNFTVIQYPGLTASVDICHDMKKNNALTPSFGCSAESFTIRNNSAFYDFYGVHFNFNCTLQLKLTCRSSAFNVTWISYEKDKRMQLKPVKYESKSLLKNRSLYSAEYIIPVDKINMRYYGCVHVSNNSKWLQNWNAQRINSSVNKQLPLHHNSGTGKFQCTLAYRNIQQESCDNPLICKILTKMITQKNATVEYNYCNVDKRKHLCAELRPLEKGIVLYSTSTKDQLPQEEIFQYQNIYYTGFNQKLYLGVDNEPPLEAILRIENFGLEKQFLENDFPAEFTFRCEAHSFYFEEGLRWFFKYKNGTQQVVPEENILNLDLDNINRERDSEFGNPTSYVKITVNDANINKIVCAAPRLSILKAKNYREWEFVSKNVVIIQTSIWKLPMPYILIMTFGFILITFIFCYTVNMYKRKFKRKYVMKRIHMHQNILESKKDEAEYPHLQHLQQYYCNFGDAVELKEHSFCIDESCILGDAQFTCVLKGSFAKLKKDAAFKTVKSQGNIAELKNLISELKIMMYIEKHINIVEFLGAYTQHIGKGIIYVAMEFCELGDLGSYIRANKYHFLNCPILTSFSQEVKYSRKLSDREAPESSYHTIRFLLKWSLEICTGMKFLHSKNVIHGDLAARNVLLTAEGVAKLTDFGLSRRTDDEEYERDEQVPLPWRWLALETLQRQAFSTKSDVWAFGITLWEMLSLGEIPYSGMSFSTEFETLVENGLRNPKPKYSPNYLYEIMIACWDANPTNRPSFATLSVTFRNILNNEDLYLTQEDLTKLIVEERAEYLILRNEEVQKSSAQIMP